MTHVDVDGMSSLQGITIAAIARAAGQGLVTMAEAAVLIDRIRDQATTPSSSTQGGYSSGVGDHTDAQAPVDPDRTVR